MTTDTPRTDACPHCGERGASIRNTHKGEEWFYDCGTHIDAGESYRTLACSRISEIRDLKGQVKVAENYKDLNDSSFKIVMNELAASQAEVDRLRSQLKRAVEIAEKIWADCSNGSEHTELAALKREIK
jgi:paraquat-inducible protein B